MVVALYVNGEFKMLKVDFRGGMIFLEGWFSFLIFCSKGENKVFFFFLIAFQTWYFTEEFQLQSKVNTLGFWKASVLILSCIFKIWSLTGSGGNSYFVALFWFWHVEHVLLFYQWVVGLHICLAITVLGSMCVLSCLGETLLVLVQVNCRALTDSCQLMSSGCWELDLGF